MADEQDDSYLSVPLMETRRRRLFTFTTALVLSVNNGTRMLVTAGEGVEDDSPDESTAQRFLVLDAVYDAVYSKMVALDPVIGVWVNSLVIASEQIRAQSLKPGPRSIRDAAPTSSLADDVASFLVPANWKEDEHRG